MDVSLSHMIRRHLRASLTIALGAAIVTFSTVLFWRISFDISSAEQQRVAEEEIRLRQVALEERIGRIERLSEEDRGSLAELALRLDSDTVGNGSLSDAPDRLHDIVGSVVELVCIDTIDKETYYTASGTIIDPSGLILTNRHILLSKDGSLIEFCGIGFTTSLQDSPKIAYIATARAEYEESDLALLEITERLDGASLPASFEAILLKDNAVPANELRLGDSIFIGGYPGIGAETFTFTQGVVSGRVGMNLIKTSALIDSGTSGGAAFDSRGRFIGVPTAAVRGDIGGSLGYLISSDAVASFLDGYYGGEYRLRTE